MARIEQLLGDENLQAVSESLRNVRDGIGRVAGARAECRGARGRIARHGRRRRRPWSQQLNDLGGELAGRTSQAPLASVRVAAEKLARTAESLERIVAGNEAALARAGRARARPNCSSCVIDVRDASAEVRALARGLREQPSSLVRESKEHGVEIAT